MVDMRLFNKLSVVIVTMFHPYYVPCLIFLLLRSRDMQYSVLNQELPDEADPFGEAKAKSAHPTVDSAAHWQHYPVRLFLRLCAYSYRDVLRHGLRIQVEREASPLAPHQARVVNL